MEQIAIYVLITVILIITSIRRNKKQQQAKLEQLKKQQASNELQQENEEGTLEDIFKKLNSQMFDEQYVNQPNVAEAETSSQKSNQPFLDYELKRASVKNPRPKRKYFTENDEVSIPDSLDVSVGEITDREAVIDFDVRQAVIYSEIINRKYE